MDESVKSNGNENRTSIRCMELRQENVECVRASCRSDKSRNSHAARRATRSVPDSCPISHNNILVYSQCSMRPGHSKAWNHSLLLNFNKINAYKKSQVENWLRAGSNADNFRKATTKTSWPISSQRWLAMRWRLRVFALNPATARMIAV